MKFIRGLLSAVVCCVVWPVSAVAELTNVKNGVRGRNSIRLRGWEKTLCLQQGVQLANHFDDRIRILEGSNSLVETFEPRIGLVMRSRRFDTTSYDAALFQEAPEVCILGASGRRDQEE